MTTKLITTTDISAIKPISQNIDSVDRLDPYIIEAQDMDIRPFLGDPLFYDIVKNSTTDPNKKLLDGGEYEYYDNTIFFDGLKVAIAYFAYSRFITNQGINITRFGVVKKITEDSENVSQETIDRLAGNARSVGLSYLNQCEKFLDTNKDTYPLWLIEESLKPKTKFRITKVANY